MKKTFLFIFALLLHICSKSASAQTFSYGLSSNTSNYTELAGATAISQGSDWNTTTFKKDIGFSFPFLGENFDSLRIEPNGFIVFDEQRNFAIATYKGLFCKKDSADNWSSISYTLSGGTLKLQFKNLGFSQTDTKELFSYQVWLYSNGNIEIHTGPNPNADYVANGQTTLLGLINMNQNTPVKAFVASGSPASPTGSALNTSDELLYLSPVPDNGRVFTFSPQ